MYGMYSHLVLTVPKVATLLQFFYVLCVCGFDMLGMFSHYLSHISPFGAL